MSKLGNLFVGYFQAHPHNPIDGGSWHNDCALGAVRFTADTVGWAVAPSGYGNAIDVEHNSGPLRGDWQNAPQLARHFFHIGALDHVTTDLDGGGTTCGSVGSPHLDWAVVPYVGINSVQSYCATSGATYAGWADNYRGGIPGNGWQDAASTAGLNTTALNDLNINLQGEDMYSIRNWETKELSLLIGTQRVVLGDTLDKLGIATVAVILSGQPPEPGTTVPGPWRNLSTAQITLLDEGLALYPTPSTGVPFDMNALAAAVAAKIPAATVTPAAPVDLSPVLTLLANIEATLTKGYTFNVKPAA